MADLTPIEKEQQAISLRRADSSIISIAGISAVLLGLLATPTMKENKLIFAGGIASIAVGLGAVLYSIKKQHSLDKESIDLEARKSTIALENTLKENNVALSPEQSAAIHAAQYNRAAQEWRDRLKAEKKAYISGAINAL